jgi:hypothetical protein
MEEEFAAEESGPNRIQRSAATDCNLIHDGSDAGIDRTEEKNDNAADAATDRAASPDGRPALEIQNNNIGQADPGSLAECGIETRRSCACAGAASCRTMFPRT